MAIWIMAWIWFDPRSFSLEPDHPRVKYFVNYLRVDRAQHVEQSMRRAQQHIEPIRHAFHQHRVPAALVWLALIESGFEVDAVSPRNAVGVFQFRASTARAFGLEVNAQRDERLDPGRAADACASYLTYLHNQFGSWELALACYVFGEGSVRRICDAYEIEDWSDVETHLPRSVSDYVYKVKAAALVASAWMQRQRDKHSNGVRLHIVQPGETLTGIARVYRVDVEALRLANQVSNDLIHHGDELIIPTR